MTMTYQQFIDSDEREAIIVLPKTYAEERHNLALAKLAVTNTELKRANERHERIQSAIASIKED
jgi:hypothetical protein